MTIWISLLRGINVGGNKIIRMADLKALYESLGLTGVQTHLQSGNVVFAADTTDHAALASSLEGAIEQRYAFDVRVILRTLDELREVIARQPFAAEQIAQPAKVAVVFLRDAPAADTAAALLNVYSGPEEMRLAGRELYVFYTQGMGRSKLTHAIIEKKLNVTGTARNWNTTTALLDMAQKLETA